ncbi:DNA binding protein, partial [Aureococcus anophagefferens]
MSSGERLTPFMLFFCEHRDVVQAAHPTLAPHELSALIADKWKALPADRARAYGVLSATYAEQKKPGVTAQPRKRKERREKDPKAPKSATSAYMYFSKHHRLLLKRENSDLTFGDLGKTVGAMWKAATPQEKKPFEDLAAADRTR